MFLGILLLVVAIVVVYFESKMRDQNHKIASMLSLVSTLAEDMSGVKMGLNQVARYQMSGQQMGGQQMGGPAPQSQPQQSQQPLENQSKSLFLQESENLIAVSDDDSEDDTEGAIDDDSDMDDSDMDDSDSDSDSCADSHSDYLESGERAVKVLRLNIQELGDSNMNLNNAFTGAEELENLDDLLDDELSVSSGESSEYRLELTSADIISADEIKADTPVNISASDLKTINISLEEPALLEPVDYKKLPLPKLRTIVAERGLADDAAKMKKNELLKLLSID
jgi:hypothetical protein